MEIIRFDGIELTLMRQPTPCDARWRSQMPPGLWCGHLSQGKVHTLREGLGQQWEPGMLLNTWVDRDVEVEHHIPTACVLGAAFIRVLPDHVEDLIGDSAASIKSSPDKTQIVRNNAVAAGLTWQMLHCSLSGPARRLYLSGKAFEMLAIALLAPSRDGVSREADIRPDEIGRAHDARDLLLAALDAPPTVPELARAVGLNARRLGVLFKIIFGSSIYSYAKSARFDHARALLGAGHTNIAQVAYRCGYHPAHFSTEFRKKFGVSPREFSGRHPAGDDPP